MKAAYYNEHGPYAAEWLRNLIKAGHIAPGEVDERSIEDVRPDELTGFTQCHFFAGIGVWSYALRRAGWPDDREIWTGSCPCQPFSAAGKGKGVDDERHLWPAFDWLIQQRRPVLVLGEQVASKDGLAWLDLVQADLENKGYAVGEIDLCAAGFGAPHIRQRSWFVAERMADSTRQQHDRGGNVRTARGSEYPDSSSDGRLENTDSPKPKLIKGERAMPDKKTGPGALCKSNRPSDSARFHRMADSNGAGPQPRRKTAEAPGYRNPVDSEGSPDRHDRPGPTNGLWRDVDWLGCRDGKWRPVESTNERMDDGTAEKLGYVRTGNAWSLNPLIEKGFSRTGRLKAYGNAINVEVATEFIRAYLDL